MKFTIYRIVLTHEETNHINAVGWGEARKNPKILAYLDCTSPLADASKFDTANFEHFEPVVEVEADDLEHAFEITNIDKDSDRVTLCEGHTNYRSSSTGDVFYCEENGKYYLCEFIGFSEVEVA